MIKKPTFVQEDTGATTVLKLCAAPVLSDFLLVADRTLL